MINAIHQKTQRGNIAASLALVGIVIMTIGIAVGVTLLSSPKPQQTATEAAAPDEVTTVENQDVEVVFDSLTTHNRWDYMLSGHICFTQNPPLNGRWRVALYHDGLTDPSLAIGASVFQRSTNPSQDRCNGAPHLTFNAPINLPDTSRLPEGETCLPAGDVSIEVDTEGPPWQLIPKIGEVDRSYFCPDPASTPGPSTTPTPGPTAAPANINATINIDGTWKDGFDEFEVQIATCDFANPDDIDSIIWDTCGTNGNGQSSINTSTRAGDTLDTTTNLTINNAEGGMKAIMLFYAYKLESNDKSDSTGVYVAPIGDPECDANAFIDYGGYGCAIDINGTEINREYNVTLPDTDVTTYELWLGKEDASGNRVLIDDPCSHPIDTTGDNQDFTDLNCSSEVVNNKVTVVYENNTGEDEKIYWSLARCNGTLDQNGRICEVNSPVESEFLVQNIFTEDNAGDVPADKLRSCVFDPSLYPTDENGANVRSSGAITCSVIDRPTETPTPQPATGTPAPTDGNTPVPNTPTPVPTEDPGQLAHFVTVSLFNNSSVAVSSIETTTCYGNNICNSELVNTSIQPQQRGVIETRVNVPEGIDAYQIECAVTFAGSSTEVPCPNSVSTSIRQNILYRMVANDGSSVSGVGRTEIDACDVNGDVCCNANDFSVVATQYANEVPPTDGNLADINGDGVINGVDLLYTQVSFGKGDRCGASNPNIGNEPDLNSE